MWARQKVARGRGRGRERRERQRERKRENLKKALCLEWSMELGV